MNPFGRILGPAFGAMLGVTQPVQDPGPRRQPAPMVAPIPREKPPVPDHETVAGTTGAAASDSAAVGSGTAADKAAKPDPSREAPIVAAAMRNGPPPAAAAEKRDSPVPGDAGVDLLSPKLTYPTDRDLGAIVVPVPRRPPDRTLGAIVVPVPRPKPDRPPPGSAANGRGTRMAAVNPIERPPEDPACLNALTSAGVQFEVLADNENGACGLAQPLKMSATAKDGIRFSPAPVMGCSATRAVLAWLEKEVQPAAATTLGGPITGIQVADSYSCRGRNNTPGAKLSEHAAGNAIDISAFQIGTGKQAHWVKVEARATPEDPEAKFLASVRKGACTYFTTVLGPGQPDHDTHFHLDIGKHGRSGTYRICQ